MTKSFESVENIKVKFVLLFIININNQSDIDKLLLTQSKKTTLLLPLVSSFLGEQWYRDKDMPCCSESRGGSWRCLEG